MQNKSFESHQEKRNSANFQRGNTREQRVEKAIAEIINGFPIIAKDIADAFLDREKSNKISSVILRNGFYSMSVIESDINGEENKISVVINKEGGIQSLKVEPQGENKENYYYSAEKVFNENIVGEIVFTKELLKTGKLSPNSLLKKTDIFDMYNFVSESKLEAKLFDQKIYDKILKEEGPDEAVKYGKGLRGAEK